MISHPVLFRQLHIMRGGILQKGFFLIGQHAHLSDRRTDIKIAARQTFARRHEAARADHHFVLNHGIVQNRRPHADQDAVADRQPCSITLCPTVTSSPITSGDPSGLAAVLWETCRTLPSCILLRAPTVMLFTSPRNTAHGHTETSSASDTSPMTTHASSIIQLSWISGVRFWKVRIAFIFPPSVRCIVLKDLLNIPSDYF